MVVALISCSKEKKNYTCPAKELYSASTLFSLSYKYAKKVADKIYILSALYGLVPEDRVIQPYNKTLLEMPRSEQISWAKRVLSDLRQECDLNEDTFIFLAGKTYGQDILPAMKHVEQPLRGLRMGERMSRLHSLIKSTPQKESKNTFSDQTAPSSLCVRLHTLFNSLPRYNWERISDISFSNGIYIVFEKGETYHGMDRIVRVGTHTSDGRLINRLRDHFVKENHDGSIFRKNIGKAILNAYHDPYLKIWTLDTSKPENAILMDKEKNAGTEARVSEFLRNNFSFAVFPVEGKGKRLRFEEGIISTLHNAKDFAPSRKWSGQYSPEAEIRTSGLWLKQGLDAEVLTETEFNEIASCCGVLRTEKECPSRKSIWYNKLVRDRIPEIIEASGKTCKTEILSDEEYLKMLDLKLGEELAGYHKDQNIEELADLIEVIYAAAKAHGYTLEELEKIRAEKAAKRGGFEKKILLKEVQED